MQAERVGPGDERGADTSGEVAVEREIEDKIKVDLGRGKIWDDWSRI